MTFQKWVAEFGGARKLSRKLGVTKQVVHFWMRREGTPKTLTILRILALSDDKLSYYDVIRSTSPKFKRGKVGKV